MALHFRGVLLPAGEETEIWVRDGRFTFEPVPGAETVSRGGWLVPGLVDAHCHVGLGPHGAVSTVDGWRDQALADRDAGTLLIRDCGSPVDTRELDTHEDLPRLIRAGRHLAPHRRYIPGVALEVDPSELPAAAAEQARRGDGWVKLVGDWIDRAVGDLTPTWSAETVTLAIMAAHDAGARVTVHTFGEDALPALINAGIDCIEHGTGLTEDLVAQMAIRGTALVPTLINIDQLPDIAASAESKFPAFGSTLRRLHASARARVRAAYEAGVPIYAGTDAGGGITHGQIAREVLALHEAGLPAEDALGAASWRARDWLGHPGVDEGAPADLCVYDNDPRADLSVLAAPARIVLRGRVVV
ncbi:MAG: amidohydrolase family protein [Geodermatophilaceae bacterium]|nr:amidohydrolase family protein [Geodermatophilaceae bacterium]